MLDSEKHIKDSQHESIYHIVLVDISVCFKTLAYLLSLFDAWTYGYYIFFIIMPFIIT
jgi:hypothetical protein